MENSQSQTECVSLHVLALYMHLIFMKKKCLIGLRRGRCQGAPKHQTGPVLNHIYHGQAP